MSKSTHLTLTIKVRRGGDIPPTSRALRRVVEKAYGVSLDAIVRATAADAHLNSKRRLGRF